MSDETKLNERLYKGKYIIALYDANDIPVGVYSNPRELATIYNKNVDTVTSHLGKIFNKKDGRKRIFKKDVYFIELD